MIDTAFRNLLPQLPEILNEHGHVENWAKALGHSKTTFLARVTDCFITTCQDTFWARCVGRRRTALQDRSLALQWTWMDRQSLASISELVSYVTNTVGLPRVLEITNRLSDQVKKLFDGVIEKAVGILEDCLSVGQKSGANATDPTVGNLLTTLTIVS